MSDQRSQREVVEAAVVEAVAKVLHDHGPMNGPATERWQDCPNGEIHGGVADKVASTMTVQALLDVVEALTPFAEAYRGSYPSQPDSNGASPQSITVGDYRRAHEALARLPEEVR